MHRVPGCLDGSRQGDVGAGTFTVDTDQFGTYADCNFGGRFGFTREEFIPQCEIGGAAMFLEYAAGADVSLYI